MIGLAVAAAIIVVVWGGLAILLRQGAREHLKTREQLDRIRALPEADARSLALRLLGDDKLFQCRTGQGAVSQPELPPSVAELFTRYEEVVRGEFWIGRSALGQTACKSGYLKVGEDSEFTQILVKPGSSEVYVSYGEQLEHEAPEASPTAWHLIIEASGIPV